MKNSKLLLTALLALPLLVACTQSVYKPKHSYPGDPFKEDETGEHGDEGDEGGEGEETEFNMTVYFFYDYSHSDEPFYKMKWYMLKPLGECPADAVLTDADAKDPLYDKFICYSEYPSSIDDSHAWNFAESYKQGPILNLYGIWAAK